MEVDGSIWSRSSPYFGINQSYILLLFSHKLLSAEDIMMWATMNSWLSNFPSRSGDTWLEGAAHAFTVLSDHKHLEYFKTAKCLNPRQANGHCFSPDLISSSLIVLVPETQRFMLSTRTRSKPSHQKASSQHPETHYLGPYITSIRTSGHQENDGSHPR